MSDQQREKPTAPWLKGMTSEEFEAWWASGPIARHWLHFDDSQKDQARKAKLLHKEIATHKDVDARMIFALMSLASDVYLELCKREQYQRGRHAVWGKHRNEFFRASATLKENPFPPADLQSVSRHSEVLAITAESIVTKKIRQDAKSAAINTKEPQIFLQKLIFLDSIPGTKNRYLRSFFACLFAKVLKTNRGGFIGRIIQFCFHERLTAKGLKQSRVDFRESFPNWGGIADQLLRALQPLKAKALEAAATNVTPGLGTGQG